MAQPRLLVLGRRLPGLHGDLAYSLRSLLGKRVSGVHVTGSGALPYSADSLINWAVAGNNTHEDDKLSGVPQGCDLYVGIRTPEEDYANQRAEDKRFDIYQLGERGFEVAKVLRKPAILLDTFDQRTICDFVQNQ